MFNWAVSCFVVAVLAAVFGYGGFSWPVAIIGKIVFGLAIAWAVVGFSMGKRARKPGERHPDDP